MTQITLRKLTRPNCRPSAVLTNYLESIAVELLALEVNVVEQDAADGPAPMIVIERNGREIGRMVGLVSTTEILDAVRAAKEDV